MANYENPSYRFDPPDKDKLEYNFLLMDTNTLVRFVYKRRLGRLLKNPSFTEYYNINNLQIHEDESLSSLLTTIDDLITSNSNAVLMGILDDSEPGIYSQAGQRGKLLQILDKYQGKRIGFFFNLGPLYKSDLDYREAGVFDVLVRGYTQTEEEFIQSIGSLIDHLFRREKFTKKSLEQELHLDVIDDAKTLEDCLKLGKLVYGADNRVDEENDSDIILDPYDLCSIPLGGFVDGRLVAMSRIITKNPIPKYQIMIEYIAKKRNHAYLNEQIKVKNIPPYLPTMMSVTEDDKINKRKGESLENYEKVRDELLELHKRTGMIEQSRLIAHPEFKGYDLGKNMMEYMIAITLLEGFDMSLGLCDPRLTEFYKPFGFNKIPEIGTIFHTGVKFYSDLILADFKKLPEPTYSNVNLFMARMVAMSSNRILVHSY